MVTEPIGTVWTATHLHDDRPALKLEVDHGVLDERGRLVGGYGFVYFVESTERRVGGWMGYVQATRNHQSFGASQFGNYYATVEEARAACERKLYDQRKSYQRKYRGNELPGLAIRIRQDGLARIEIQGLTYIRDNGPVWPVAENGQRLIPGVASGAFNLRTFESQGLIEIRAGGWVLTPKGRDVLAEVAA